MRGEGGRGDKGEGRRGWGGIRIERADDEGSREKERRVGRVNDKGGRERKEKHTKNANTAHKDIPRKRTRAATCSIVISRRRHLSKSERDLISRDDEIVAIEDNTAWVKVRRGRGKGGDYRKSEKREEKEEKKSKREEKEEKEGNEGKREENEKKVLQSL